MQEILNHLTRKDNITNVDITDTLLSFDIDNNNFLIIKLYDIYYLAINYLDKVKQDLIEALNTNIINKKEFNKFNKSLQSMKPTDIYSDDFDVNTAYIFNIGTATFTDEIFDNMQDIIDYINKKTFDATI